MGEIVYRDSEPIIIPQLDKGRNLFLLGINCKIHHTLYYIFLISHCTFNTYLIKMNFV